MLSKNQVKLIQKLHHKRHRNELNFFIVEGKRSINELLQAGYTPQLPIAIEASTISVPQHLTIPVSKDELRKVSTLQNPDEGLTVFQQSKHKGILREGVIVALGNVQDPGDLGTIIRLCGWFRVETPLYNTQTVDCYNLKVVQVIMGSLIRVAMHYLDLAAFLTTTALPVYTMDLEGENLYTATFPKDCILILGNEANSISSEVRVLSNEAITIPRFSQHQHTKSLNIAMAGAIILSEVMGHH